MSLGRNIQGIWQQHGPGHLTRDEAQWLGERFMGHEAYRDSKHKDHQRASLAVRGLFERAASGVASIGPGGEVVPAGGGVR